MANLNQVKSQLESLKSFYDSKSKLIIDAYNCCTSNPCNEVNAGLESIKSKLLSELSKSNGWSDSAGSSFKQGISNCVTSLDTIKSSISSSWNSAETLYKANYGALNNLKSLISKLESQIASYPNKSNSKYNESRYNIETKTYEKHFNHSKYQKDVNIWEQESDSLIHEVDELLKTINENINELNAINAAVISIEQNINSIIESNKYLASLTNKAVLIPTFNMDVFPGSQIEIDNEYSLMQLINMCYKEQASLEGVAFECSQVINYFIHKNGYEPTKVSELAQIMQTKWYGSRTRKAANYTDYRLDGEDASSYIQVATEVLQGNRVLPVYVWEHDQIPIVKNSGISYITLNGQRVNKNNRDNYVRGQTVIHNVAGAKYTFYAFPPNGGDPFGYFAEDYNKFIETENI